jgi:hypothetical protein
MRDRPAGLPSSSSSQGQGRLLPRSRRKTIAMLPVQAGVMTGSIFTGPATSTQQVRREMLSYNTAQCRAQWKLGQAVLVSGLMPGVLDNLHTQSISAHAFINSGITNRKAAEAHHVVTTLSGSHSGCWHAMAATCLKPANPLQPKCTMHCCHLPSSTSCCLLLAY